LTSATTATPATSGAGTTDSTAANAPNFLNKLLLNVQSGGHGLSALGGNVNAKV
jgi:hypothetical protein